jgi:PPOX class probable F420-dependent enzyme
MAVAIGGWARDFLQRPGSFGVLTTLMADGSPISAVIWYDLRDDGIVVNSAVGRAWPTNLLRDGRFSLAVEAGYSWVGLRGIAEPITDQATAQADIASMARRYNADDPAKAERLIDTRFTQQERISFMLRPDAVSEHPDD